MSRRRVPAGVRHRCAPSRTDVVALRRAYLARNMGQLRIMRLTATLLIPLALFFAWISYRAAHPIVPWIVTGVCVLFAVLSRLLVRRVERGVERYFNHPVTTIFTDDSLYIDDELSAETRAKSGAELWCLPYAAITRLDRGAGVNQLTDVEGGLTFLALDAIPEDELHRFPVG